MANQETQPEAIPFYRDQHKEYIKHLDDATESFAYWITEHLKMSGVYWGLSAMALLDALHEMDFDKITDFVLSCEHPNGGFSGNKHHSPHLLYTLSAVQIMALINRMHLLNVDKITAYVKGLQKEDGSFVGDEWGEVDTRFSYCAINCLYLLGKLKEIDEEKALEYIVSCKNFDGAFGCVVDAESHAGQTFCCVAALALLGKLNKYVDRDLLGWWLAERQLPCGGLNGRPEKLEDVCYSWWVLSSLCLLKKVHWINEKKLIQFILTCQDEKGGISDRPNDIVDVFHTFFGIAGLSFLGYPNLLPIDPALALPISTLKQLNIDPVWLN